MTLSLVQLASQTNAVWTTVPTKQEQVAADGDLVFLIDSLNGANCTTFTPNDYTLEYSARNQHVLIFLPSEMLF
jgi:hypothetical protein